MDKQLTRKVNFIQKARENILSCYTVNKGDEKLQKFVVSLLREKDNRDHFTCITYSVELR